MEWYLRFLLRGILGLWESPKVRETKGGRHSHLRGDTVRSMNHAACDCLLLLIVCLLIRALRNFNHVLEVKEATECISVSLGLHNGQGLLVMSALTMHWASSNMDLLILAAFYVLLVLHVLEVLKVLHLLLIVLLLGTLLLGSWTLILLASPVDVVRLDLEILLLFACWARLARGRAPKDAIISSSWLRPLVWPDVLSSEWVDPARDRLKGMFVVLFRLTILKLTLRGSRTFLRSTALDQVVVVAHAWLSVATSIARGNPRVARKIEQLLAEWRDIRSLLHRLVFLNALLENAIHLLGWLGGCPTSVAHVTRCLNVGAHLLLVWACIGPCASWLGHRCISLGIIAIFSDYRCRFLNFVLLIIWDWLAKIFWIDSLLAIQSFFPSSHVCHVLGWLLWGSHAFTA